MIVGFFICDVIVFFMFVLEVGGVDIIEFGVLFSDLVVDGLVI